MNKKISIMLWMCLGTRMVFFFFSSRRRHTRCSRDWSSDVCSSDLTLDFDQADSAYPIQHYCFRVSEKEFEAILGRIRAAGIKYRSTVHGPVDMKVDTQHGGRIVYWNEPDVHQWELLTVSYARQPKSRG